MLIRWSPAVLPSHASICTHAVSCGDPVPSITPGRCTVCGHASVTFDPFWDLSLPIPSRSGQLRLQACFDLFTKEEVLDGDEKPVRRGLGRSDCSGGMGFCLRAEKKQGLEQKACTSALA